MVVAVGVDPEVFRAVGAMRGHWKGDGDLLSDGGLALRDGTADGGVWEDRLSQEPVRTSSRFRNQEGSQACATEEASCENV